MGEAQGGGTVYCLRHEGITLDPDGRSGESESSETNTLSGWWGKREVAINPNEIRGDGSETCPGRRKRGPYMGDPSDWGVPGKPVRRKEKKRRFNLGAAGDLPEKRKNQDFEKPQKRHRDNWYLKSRWPKPKRGKNITKEKKGHREPRKGPLRS